MAAAKQSTGPKGGAERLRFTKYEDIRKILQEQTEAALVGGESRRYLDLFQVSEIL